MEKWKEIRTLTELKTILENCERVSLYGAGFYLGVFLSEIQSMNSGLLSKVKQILVTSKDENKDTICGIPVREVSSVELSFFDTVFFTLGDRFVPGVYDTLKASGATMYRLDFNMFQREPYENTKKQLQEYIEGFPDNVSGKNLPEEGFEATVWVFWWQGLDEAPEMVKACVESQRKNLPAGFRQIIITKNNYKDYIFVPDHIMEKVEKGFITFTTLSDIFRVTLLYRYGGFWMDATLLVLKPIPDNICNYSIYTRNLPEVQYCTNVMWADWFIFAKKGNKLFRFVMEAFYYYYSKYDKIRYYFTIDYFIAIACNEFKDVEFELKKIPYNNERALELCKHLTETFQEERYKAYISESFVQKLTYKINWGNKNHCNTIYEYIVYGG